MRRTAQLAFLGSVLYSPGVLADSVAQIQTAKRISRQTVTLLDPQGRPGTVPGGSDTTARPGDILTFVIQFTAVPNNANRGLGGYITDYVPRNTEVVGARLVDRSGNTVSPHRGGIAPDGVGPRGPGTFTGTVALNQGSIAQLYADTGIFFSTDARTARARSGTTADARFISLFNGVPLSPEPTGAGQLRPILGAPSPMNAHSVWDLIQAYAFGVARGGVSDRGVGNSPDFYGSPVAGPDSWYPYEASYAGPAGGQPSPATVRALDRVGPWRRIRTRGAETGRRGVEPDANGDLPDPGLPARVGVPAIDGDGHPLGWDLSPANPLPSYDATNPSAPYTTAVRFAVGELVVGEEYFAEISLRVIDTPLDPLAGLDVNCAEVFGGDASARSTDGRDGGKDNPWRYFLPAPSCVVLNNFFEIAVDKLAALRGDRLTYTIEGKNLSTNPQTNVGVRQCFPSGELDFVSATGGAVLDSSGSGCPAPGVEDAIVWTVGTLGPGDQYLFTIDFTIAGGADTALSRAIYTSDALPAPGFQVVAMTNIAPLAIIRIDATATPSEVISAPARVHYVATFTNVGTGTARAGCAACQLSLSLPAEFTYVAGTAGIDGTAVADPTVTGRVLSFTSGLSDIPPGATLTLELDVDLAAGVPPGAYTIAIESWFQADRQINDARAGLAEVLVGILRSDPPFVRPPLLSGATTVTGRSSEASGSTIRVLANGILAGSATVDSSGSWSVRVPPLFAGQNITATAEAVGELESRESSPPVVVRAVNLIPDCSDGTDNDGDTFVDFPDDPGCVDGDDIDETDVPECSDGLDNDNDGEVDFPWDLSCSSFRDGAEGGPPECSDGVDNDGNLLVDMGDPGCSSSDDPTETTLPACSDGLDNDDDLKIDYPFDPGCFSALDEDEVDGTVPSSDAGVVDSGPVRPDGGDADGGSAGGQDAQTDPGGVVPPLTEQGASGCGCAAARGRGSSLGWSVLALIALWARKRRGAERGWS